MGHKSKSGTRLEAEREGFYSIEQIESLNKSKGFHWFDKDTLRYWHSRFSSEVYAGRYFVSSEDNYDHTGRRYTIREALNDGQINTVGEFQQYGSRAPAHRAIEKLADSIRLVYVFGGLYEQDAPAPYDGKWHVFNLVRSSFAGPYTSESRQAAESAFSLAKHHSDLFRLNVDTGSLELIQHGDSRDGDEHQFPHTLPESLLREVCEKLQAAGPRRNPVKIV